MNLVCTKCKESKDESEYSLRSTSKNIYHKHCKTCVSISTQNHYNNNKNDYIFRASVWTKENFLKRLSVAKNSYAILRGYSPCDCCSQEEIDIFLSNCPKTCHVDHIKNVRQQGKHCLKNLRHLSVSDHCRKSQWERYNT